MTLFNSRNSTHRSPLGAVADGTRVHFKITLPRDMQCSASYLLVQHPDNRIECLDMFWCGMNGNDHEWWECHFTPQKTGLYFYHFELRTSRGRSVLKKDLGGEARAGAREDWQLTVYDGAYKTPDWLAGGILYQIFPDRFAFSGKAKENVPADRTLHENWLDQPDWKPNAQGIVTNSDFFGGDLKGIEEKLDYLASLGVTCIYLNPIFESHSNHRYDTANYEKIDPLLGDEEDFRSLCAAAKERNIHVLLDGVFSHTGSDSIYFNREGRYGDGGAYRSQSSPYYPWYSFRSWPNDYECWWNFITLPNVREENPAYDNYINGEDGIIRHWLEAGASGWRLDVADELPDSFIQKLNAAARREKSDALIIGEVWEDASNKIAYSERRRYFQGGELDSVMNYPLRDAILGFLNGGTAEHFAESMECIRENYPRDVFYNLMNVVGTHDTARALTLLGVTENEWKMDRNGRAHYQLPPDRLEIALRRLRMAAVIQFTMPGSPTIYYGDEAGQQGFEDPFNRRTYPWGHENQELLAFYRKLCEIRAEEQTLADGDLQFSDTTAGALLRYERTSGDSRLVIVVNRGHQYAETKIDALYALDLLSGEGFAYADPDGLIVSVPPETAYILRCVNAAD